MACSLPACRNVTTDCRKRLRCGHEFHTRCILDWFVSSDDCPVCGQVQKTDQFLIFKSKVQNELREKYKCAIQTYEDELNRLRSTS